MLFSENQAVSKEGFFQGDSPEVSIDLNVARISLFVSFTLKQVYKKAQITHANLADATEKQFG